MEQRTCPVCRQRFTPTSHNQVYCPPSKRSGKGQARSRCARRAMNYRQRGRALPHIADLPLPAPFGCAHCGKRCVPGEDGVAPHAMKFCGYDCKAAWHRGAKRLLPVEVGRDRGLIARWREHCAVLEIEAALGRTLVNHDAGYRRAMRADPCCICGGPSEGLDHIVPKADGGPDDWTNRSGICRTCNSHKGRLPLLEALTWVPVATEYHRRRRELKDFLDNRKRGGRLSTPIST